MPIRPIHIPSFRIPQLNAFEIKFFMALLMVLDHLDHIPGLLSTTQAGVFHVITRCVAVWFAYAAVEGFWHTRNSLLYNLRLLLWALGMALGNLLYNHMAAEKGLSIHNNIFLTLAVGVLALNILSGEHGGKPTTGGKLLRIVMVTALVALGFIFTEGGIVLLPFMLITYTFRSRHSTRNLLYLALSIFLFAISYQPYPTARETLQMLAFNSDFLFLTVLPFLSLYNGKRGPKTTFTKYFFYLFYPLHLWILGANALKMA